MNDNKELERDELLFREKRMKRLKQKHENKNINSDILIELSLWGLGRTVEKQKERLL